MSTDNTAQDRIATLREDITTTEKKLKRIERTPAKNSMLAAATAARLSELRTELATLEEEARERVGIEKQAASLLEHAHNLAADSNTVTADLNADPGVLGRLASGNTAEILYAAQTIATHPHGRTPLGIAGARMALDLTKPTHEHEDGWLWADEALSRIEQGDNSRAHWEKLADNLTDLLPDKSDGHE